MKAPPNGFSATGGEGEDFKLIVSFFCAFVSNTCLFSLLFSKSSQVFMGDLFKPDAFDIAFFILVST